MAHADFSIATIEWGANTITLLDLMKDILGITDNTQDIELSMYLQIAGEACEKYIDNKIASQTYVETFSHARSQVALRYYPVVSITSVVIDGDEDNAITDYTQFKDSGIDWLVGNNSLCTLTVSQCFRSLEIGYRAGYEPIPAELGYAVVVAGIAYQSERGAVSGAVKKEHVVGVGSVEYDVGDDVATGVGLLPAGIIPVLDTYRRYHV